MHSRLCIEYAFVYSQMDIYERYVYNPLQRYLSPVIVCIPRCIMLSGHSVTIFTANGVTLARTILIVPVALCLKLVAT